MGRQWLESTLTHTIIPALAALEDNPEGHQEAERINEELRQSWTDRRLVTLAQQQGPMDQTRRTIKDELGEDHFSLDFIKFTSDEYIELNTGKQVSVAERNEQTQFLDHPDAIVTTAVRLLESPEWAEVSAALAVLTGRRSAELLSTATFTPATQWSVTFTGALKRRGEPVQLSFEIPTLTTAQKVCTALDRLRQNLHTEGMTPREINQQYEAPVARACDRHFARLVPTRPGRDNLYTHLFRAVYATIATFWYCPPSVNETEFKAAIQGHFAVLDEENPELRRSLTASRHYSDYDIADAVIAAHGGKRKGIKLGHGGVVPIAMFANAMETRQPSERHETASVRVWKDDRAKLNQMFVQLGVATPDRNQQERMHQLISWAYSQLVEGNGKPLIESAAEDASAPLQSAPETHTLLFSEPQAPTPSPLESKMETLIETMQQLMTTIAPALQRQSAPAAQQPAKRAEPKAVQPKPMPVQKESDPQSDTTTTRKYRPKQENEALAEQAIAAIKAHNDTPGMPHDEKWAITINALKVLGVSQRQAVKALEEHASDIREHHQRHQIDGEKHNLRHRRKRLITDVIHL